MSLEQARRKEDVRRNDVRTYYSHLSRQRANPRGQYSLIENLVGLSLLAASFIIALRTFFFNQRLQTIENGVLRALDGRTFKDNYWQGKFWESLPWIQIGAYIFVWACLVLWFAQDTWFLN